MKKSNIKIPRHYQTYSWDEAHARLTYRSAQFSEWKYVSGLTQVGVNSSGTTAVLFQTIDIIWDT